MIASYKDPRVRLAGTMHANEAVAAVCWYFFLSFVEGLYELAGSETLKKIHICRALNRVCGISRGFTRRRRRPSPPVSKGFA